AEANVASTLGIGDSATIHAVHDTTIASTTGENITVLAEGAGGGLVATGASNSGATLNYASQVKIGTGTVITAGNNLTVQALGSVTVDARAKSDTSGLGTNAKADTYAHVGSSSNDGVSTRIGQGARLEGSTVAIGARMTAMNVTTNGDAHASAFGA